MHRASRFVFILFALALGCAQNPAAPLSTQAGEEAVPSPKPQNVEDEKSANQAEAKHSQTAEPQAQPPALGAPTKPQPPAVSPEPAAQPRLEPLPTSDSQPTQDRPDAYVTLAQFTTEIEDQEPVDSISFLDTQQSEIIFFTDVQGFAGETLIHRWEYQGQVMAQVPFDVQEDYWRGWSSKQLLPDWVGDWTVSVVKSDGEVIAAESFSYSRNR